MKPYEQKTSTELIVAIILSITIVFVADSVTPLGVALWIFYVIPLVLSFYSWNSAAPVLVSAAATIFTIAGFFLSSPRISTNISAGNRIFGLSAIWTLGIFGRQFIHHKLIVREQSSLRIAQTGLARHILGEQTLPSLGDKILHFVAEYIDAQVGVIYLKAEDGLFRRFGSYAMTGDELAQRNSLEPGAGLSGQAIKDKRPLVLSDVPENYLSVSSALGKSRPRHIIIAPATGEDEVEAIMEFGLMRPVSPWDLKLFEAISESTGMAVRALKYRNRLEMLLGETQRQAEELQTQSEELRVANEELEEQSHQLQESQVRLENQQSELEETNVQLEEQKEVLEGQKLALTQAQTTLSTRADDLARSSRYKSEFLANMSHELRTPLNSSLILAKLLADNRNGNLTPEQVKFAQTIYSAGNDLLELINDILDLSKIEAGRVTLRVETVGIKAMLESLSRTFLPMAEQKHLSFSVDVAPQTPASIATDHQRLEQILKNLVSNAIKFTTTGGVSIRAFPCSSSTLGFSVQDTGIGIPPGQQEIIFDAFRQADGSTNRRYGGTGLGLSISRDLAKLLGGSIRVDSEPGKGSLFTLIVPLTPGNAIPGQTATEATLSTDTAKPPATLPAAPTNSQKPRIAKAFADDRNNLVVTKHTLLVVDDDERFASILFDLAHEVGFQCLVALSAADGLALANQHHPEAIALDMRLPDQSGLYVLDQLKRDPATRHIPVHVISAVDYMHTALELGAFGYDLKPVGREQLIKALRKMEAKLLQPIRRVLIVEDDDRQRESMTQLLAASDLEIVAVRTAAETLALLKESVFDCLVMDLGLEDMSGYDLLDTMANGEAYSFPPVIIYTGRTLQPMDEQRLQRYSRSIIVKGARSPERLLDEVTLFLHQVETRLPPDQQKLLRRVRNRDAALEGRRIMVVEDDIRNIFAITSVLEPKGARLEIARTGKEALSALQRSVETKDPIDLVLMDIMMPEMDGLTATREIRKNPEFGKVPIIALTAKAMPDDRDQCIAAGANDYISKPLDVDKLLSLARVWMPKS